MLRIGLLCGLWMFWAAHSVAGSYVSGGVGLGHFSLENPSSLGGQDTSYGGFVKLGFGFRFEHTLLVGGAFRWWNADDEDDDDDGYEDELIQHVLFHDFHFAGFSGGVDIQSFLPGFNSGPFVRYGRHCWFAQVYDYSNTSGSNECGDIWALGFLKANEDSQGGLMFEVEWTRLGDVDATVFVMGVQY